MKKYKQKVLKNNRFNPFPRQHQHFSNRYFLNNSSVKGLITLPKKILKLLHKGTGPILFNYLPIGISCRWFRLRLRTLSEVRSPICTGRCVISLQDTSNFIRVDILPISSGRLTSLLLLTTKACKNIHYYDFRSIISKYSFTILLYFD